MAFLFIVAGIIIWFYDFIYKKWKYKGKFIFKSVMIYLSLGVLFLVIWILIFSVDEVMEARNDDMLESRMKSIKSYEAEADYVWISKWLTYNHDYEPEFEYSWERVLMNEYCNRYKVFYAAEKNGMGKEYEVMADKYHDKLLNLCTEPVYQENIPYGKDFIKRAGLVVE